MTDTDTTTAVTDIIGRVTYRNDSDYGSDRTEWLYVVAATDDTLYGVTFHNQDNDARPAWASVPRNQTRADNDATGYGKVLHPLTVVDWWPTMLADFFRTATTPRVSGDQDTDQAYARGVADGRSESDRRHQAWIDSLVSDAHEFADDNSLCSEFDRFMEEHGLPTRARDYSVTLSLSYTVNVSVTARDADQAEAEAIEQFRNYPRDYVDFSEVGVEVEDVEVE